MTLGPGTKLGAYEIADHVGSGGMGAVYRAYQRALGRFVAIKVLPPQTSGDPQFAQRFVQEALAVGRLRHPNIVAAFDFAQENGVAYLVSEFVDGGTLGDQIGTALPLAYVVRILTPIASALDYAHARGLVQRDVKPTNILLHRDATPVLTDFGLARIVGPGSGPTQTNALVGTAAYIAPEVIGGGEAGPAADQYALAIVAYELLTGRHPFPLENPLAALMAHSTKPVPRPSELGVKMDVRTEDALLRGLAKKPEKRFASVSAFVEALGARERESTRAVESAPVVVAAQPKGRRRLVVIGAGILAALLVLAVLSQRLPEDAAGAVATLASTSTPLSLDRGASGECVVAYRNDGTEAWTIGAATEVWLYLPESVPAPVRSWATDLGGGIVAGMRSATIEPGQIGLFSVTITVPERSTEGQATISVLPINAAGAIGDEASCLVNVR